jgi:Protein of unknown function (DUF3467)
MTQADSKSGAKELHYPNYFCVGHARCEVILEFGQSFEGSEPQVHTRVVTTPGSAGDLLGLLRESLERYRATAGSLELEDSHE